MPRIPEEELKKLKDEIDLVALIQSKGVALSKQGNDYKGLCPFHEEKTPSFVVTPAKGLWHCFGCGVGGTVVDFVMQTEKVSFRHAVEILKEGNFEELGESIKKNYSTVPALKSPVSFEADEQKILQDVLEYYHERLSHNPQARKYLEKRGIGHPELLKRFRIGFCDRTLGLRLPYKNRQSGKKIRDSLQKIGLLKESGHEHFRGSVVFPVFDENGRIREIYGRKICDRLRPDTPKHTYLPGAHGGLFNEKSLEHQSKEIILCECIIDALSVYQSGFVNVTAAFGVNGFTEEMLSLFLRHGIRRVYILYDSDAAGNKAAEKLGTVLYSEGIEPLRVKLPKDEDANSFLCQSTNPKEELKRLINTALRWEEPAVSAKEPPARVSYSLAAKEKSLAAGEEIPGRKEKSCSEQAAAKKSYPEEAPADLPEKAPAAPQKTASAESRENPPDKTPAEEPDQYDTSAALNNSNAISKEPIKAELSAGNIHINLGNRQYRIRGLEKNLAFDVLRVNIKIAIAERYFIDTFDLYHARNRAGFISAAAKELDTDPEIIRRDLGQVLLKLEELQEKNISGTLENSAENIPVMNDAERKEALEFLQSPDLLKRIAKDFETCGLVGEEINSLIIYLAAVSRKLDDPLAIIIQSSSASGKSSLMNACLDFIPEEEQVRYTAMTGQSLFYMGENDLVHKTLAISEEEGAESASYSLKTFQSEKMLRIASTGKDGSSGRLITHEYTVQGPVQLMMTTTSAEINHELENRCITLGINESREQTKAIHQLQRLKRTEEGLLRKREREKLLLLHQNAQRLLRNLSVLNPFSARLKFLDNKLRTRRDHEKYLSLIDAIAFLHQYQRPVKKLKSTGDEYVEVSIRDIEIANQLASAVLGKSLDELAPQTRKLLELIHEFVKEKCLELEINQELFRFTRKQVRDFSGWSDSQLKIHMHRLEELEYLLILGGGKGRHYRYELLYQGEGRNSDLFLLGLLDTKQLYDANRSGQNEEWSASSQGQVWAKSGGCLSGQIPDWEQLIAAIPEKYEKTHIIGLEKRPFVTVDVRHNYISKGAEDEDQAEKGTWQNDKKTAFSLQSAI
jgi:DNA primase catalytic core